MLCNEHKIHKKLCTCPEKKKEQSGPAIGLNFMSLQSESTLTNEDSPTYNWVYESTSKVDSLDDDEFVEKYGDIYDGLVLDQSKEKR